MKKFVNASKKALQDTALLMTADIRSHALNAGWDAEAANSLRVVRNNGTFEVVVPESKSNYVKSFEYGTEVYRPNAALRQYANRPENGLEMYMARFKKHLGGTQ